MANHDLDKEYAALSLLTKALYQDQLITREVYETYLFRYSRKLIASHNLESKMSAEQRLEKQRVEEKQRQFSMVLDQWQIHGLEWRKKWIETAKEWIGKVPNANLILELEK